MSNGETADTLLESTRTFNRYRVKPAACYENRMLVPRGTDGRERADAPAEARPGTEDMPVAVLRSTRGLSRPTAVPMTADYVRQLLQHVYSEGVIGGGEGVAA